jgi:hypothetical protein
MSPRILLITPQFYGIEKKIKSVLEELGYEVSWIENKTLLFDYHGTRSKFKLFRKFYFLLFSPQKKYLRSEFRKIGESQVDILFAINAHAVNPWSIRKLKKDNPRLVSILYLWDSTAMYNWAKEIKWFDNVFTFDPADAIKYDITYKPNFYLKYNNSPSVVNDLLFVGKYSIERKILIDKIIEQIHEKVKFFVKLIPAYNIFPHNVLVYKLFKVLNLKSVWIIKYLANYEAVEGITERDYLINKGFNYDDVQEQLLRSNVVLDLPFDQQNGYTHRLIEALANGKKVLTTNSEILKEDFFNPNQIHLLAQHSPDLDIDWIKERTMFPVDKFFHNLELSNWLISILDVSILKNNR